MPGSSLDSDLALIAICREIFCRLDFHWDMSIKVNKSDRQSIDKLERLSQQDLIIHQQAEFLRLIYDNVREAIFVVDIATDGKFYYQGFNPAAKKLTGIEDVVNKTPAQIFPPETATRIIKHYQECLSSKATVVYEECLPFQGKTTWWLTTLNPITDETGKIARIVGTSSDITQQKNAEIELDKEKKFLETLLENLSDGIVACDHKGVLNLFNRATREFHGLPQQPLPSEEWAKHYDLYCADGQTPLKQEDVPLFRALQGESVRDAEIMIIPKRGQARTLLANGDPIINSKGEKIGAIATMRDISDRKQADLAIAELNQELEARVQKRTAELEKANKLLLIATEQLQKSNQELEQFAYVTSHDLKAPLRAIATLSEWIEEDLDHKLDEATQENMRLLRGRVYRLENLINGLLRYSRVGRLKSTRQTVMVDKLLAEIIDSLDVPPDFTIEIRGKMPTLVTAEAPLNQVFSNLIVNAIEHSDRKDTKIVITAVERDQDYEFKVSDNGSGIDPKYHQRIFTIFQTLKARDLKESTGIGLAIVKKAVESQGGTIAVTSSLGQGTTFSFTWNKI